MCPPHLPLRQTRVRDPLRAPLQPGHNAHEEHLQEQRALLDPGRTQHRLLGLLPDSTHSRIQGRDEPPDTLLRAPHVRRRTTS